jgi:hypothetical protein
VLQRYQLVKRNVKMKPRNNFKMKKIIVSLILLVSFPIGFAAVLAPKIAPNMVLKPLCFTDLASCHIAQTILNLPSSGNFQLNSQCRDQSQFFVQRGICIGFSKVLEIRAMIDLPYIGQFQWRNQCYPNLYNCNIAKQIWSQLNHPQDLFMFNVVCDFPVPAFWNVNDQRMDQLGLFRCTPQNGPMELKVQAKRIK